MNNKKTNFFKALACFSALSLSFSVSSKALAVENTEDFTDVVTFGDSFVGNSGSYAQTLTEQFGFAFTRNETNFAIGGQGTSYTSAQLTNYLNRKGKFGANDLVIYDPLSSEFVSTYNDIGNGLLADVFAVEIEGTDGYNILQNDLDLADLAGVQAAVLDGSLEVNATNFPNLFAFYAETENNSQTFTQRAVDNGANYILMSNHYNESLRQANLNNSGIDKEVGDILSRKMGEALINGALKVPNANVILWNEADFTQALIDSPSTYLTAEQIALGNNALGLGVFDNTAHETAPVNNIKRQFVASVITSPSLVSTLRENPLVLGAKTAQRTFSVARNNSDFSKLPGVAASCDTCGDRKFALQLFTDVGGNYTGNFSKKKLGFNDDVSLSIGVGANYKVRDNIVVGMNVDYVDTKTKFVSKRGKADIKESAVSVHGVYNFEKPIFVYASTGIGNVNYNITRKIALGLTERTEKGKTSGRHLFSTLGTGYNYNMTENLVATPFVAGHYQSVTMKDYSENNPSSFSSMDFRIPKRESIMAEVGMTVSSEYFVDNTKVTPSLTASYLYDFKDPIDNKAQGRNLRNYRYFKVPTYSVAKSNIQLQGNVAADISNQYKVNLNAGARVLGKVKSWSIGLGGAINL